MNPCALPISFLFGGGGVGEGESWLSFFFFFGYSLLFSCWFFLKYLNENILVMLQLPIVPLVVSDYRSIFNKANKTFTSGEPCVLTISW